MAADPHDELEKLLKNARTWAQDARRTLGGFIHAVDAYLELPRDEQTVTAAPRLPEPPNFTDELAKSQDLREIRAKAEARPRGEPGSDWVKGIARNPRTGTGGNVHKVKFAHEMPGGEPGQMFCKWICGNASVNATRKDDDAEVTCPGCVRVLGKNERARAAQEAKMLKRAAELAEQGRKAAERAAAKKEAKAAKASTPKAPRSRRTTAPLKVAGIIAKDVDESREKAQASTRPFRRPGKATRKKSKDTTPPPLKRYDMTSGLPERVDCPCGCPKKGYLNKNTGHTRDCMCQPCADHNAEVIARIEARRERATRYAGIGGL